MHPNVVKRGLFQQMAKHDRQGQCRKQTNFKSLAQILDDVAKVFPSRLKTQADFRIEVGCESVHVVP